MKRKANWFFSLFLVSVLALFLVLPLVSTAASGNGQTVEDGEGTATVATRGGGEPWEVTSLDISKDVDEVRAPGWWIELQKTASVSEMEMEVGETREVTFTINLNAGMGSTYHISGNIFVLNTGEWPADVIGVSDTVWYKAGGPTWLAASSSITTTVPLGDDAIPAGGPHVYSYSGTFTLPVSLDEVTALSNLIEITISNKPDPPKPGMQDWTFHSREDFDKPAPGDAGVVDLHDVEWMVPDEGLDYEVNSVTINGSPTASLAGPWALDLSLAPYTVVVEKELTAHQAGAYTLHNKAAVGELEDEVEVDILVRDGEPEEEDGSIEGTKYLDLDADGILDAGEPGLSGVVIRLYRAAYQDAVDAASPVASLSWTPVAETVTDGEGDFHFQGLPPGPYRVEEEVPEGYFPTSDTGFQLEIAAEETGRVVFLNAEMARLTGEKLDYSTGEPLEEVAFVLQGAGDDGLILERKSDAEGFFDFGWLMPGEYVLSEVLPEGWLPVGSELRELVLENGERVHEVFIDRRPASVIGYKWLDENGDGVHQEYEPPLEGVKVTLTGEGVELEALTGEDGGYGFTGLYEGKYLLREEVPSGYYPTTPEEVIFELHPGEARRQDFLNAPRAAVNGFKWLDSDGDGEADPAEPGLAGIVIHLLDGEGLVLDTRVTTAEGYYLFDGLVPGAYAVEEVVPEGYEATVPVKVSFELAAGEERRVDFLNAVLVAGEVVTPPVTPPMAPIVGGGTEALPATGFTMTLFLVGIGLLLAAGFLSLSLGLVRMRRAS